MIGQEKQYTRLSQRKKGMKRNFMPFNTVKNPDGPSPTAKNQAQ